MTRRALDQLEAIPGAEVLSAIPTPYDDMLGTAKVDWHPGANHTLFARFAYQDQSSPNDQIPVPATARPEQRATPTPRPTTTSWPATPGPSGAAQLNQFTFHFQDFKNEILPNVTGVPLQIFPTVDTGPTQHAAADHR